MTARLETLAVLRSAIFGEVLLARDRVTGERVAVKTVELALAVRRQARGGELAGSDVPVHENVLREVDVLERVAALGGHPNVVALRECLVSPGGATLHIVMDFCDGGDLYDACILRSASEDDECEDARGAGNQQESRPSCLAKRLDEDSALAYFADVAAGVAFLHSIGVAHRDLSLENILLQDGRAVIADFGLCVQGPPTGERFECCESVGKHYYMAPEVALGQPYDPKAADVWSMGIALFILLTSSPPFDAAVTSDSGFRYVLSRGIKSVFQAWGLDGCISPATQDLVARMLAIDPQQRISALDMQSHPALAGRCAQRLGEA